MIGAFSAGGYPVQCRRAASFSRALAAALLAAMWIGLVAPCARAEVSEVAGGIKFTYRSASAGSVAWAGAFNAWNTSANPMTKEGDLWSVVLKLPAGEQQYKLFVDGNWVVDPDNPQKAGDFGNSVVRVGDDGKLVASVVAVASSLNPKVDLGGRLIARYVARRVAADDNRIELGRPDFDLDVNTMVHVNEMLDARMLTNIESESENVQFFRTRLNFDRGYLHLRSAPIDLFAFDNDSLGTWDDPLHLVGDIGIYHHAFGYHQQGVQARKKDWMGNDVRLMYSDNFVNGGASRPASSIVQYSYYTAPAGGYFDRRVFTSYKRSFGDNAKNTFAGRITREVTPELRLGVTGRLDRGQNPGVVAIATPDSLGADGHSPTARLDAGPTLERWYTLGADASWKTGGATLTAEYLGARSKLDLITGSTSAEITIDGAGKSINGTPIPATRSLPISDDSRAALGWSGTAFGLAAKVDWTLHTEKVYPLGNDSLLAAGFGRSDLPTLSNHYQRFHVGVERAFTLDGARSLTARLDLAAHRFSYDAGTPWQNQFWFDRHNMWLDAGEHKVSYDLLTLLGGNDVVSWKPQVAWDALAHPELRLKYLGTFNGVSFDTRPKYAESVVQADMKVGAHTRLYYDVRWARYDDPALDITHGYLDHFVRLSYDFGPGIQFQASWGVDPYVLDPPVNEYAYIGRDQFLFAQKADGSTAQDNFLGLARNIPAAEQALQDERRIQLQAIVRF